MTLAVDRQARRRRRRARAGRAGGQGGADRARAHAEDQRPLELHRLGQPSGGKPVAATVTEQIVDPIGGVHPVEFGNEHEEHHQLAVQGNLQGLHHLAGQTRAASRSPSG